MLYHKLVEEHLSDPRVVLSDGTRNMTFRQIHEEVGRYCDFFLKKGVRKGERVLIMEYDPIELVLISLACTAMGIIFVPVNRQIDTETKKEIIADSAPALILEEKVDLKPYYGKLGERFRNPVDTLVYILYTSGTSGKPKGIVASQKQIFFCCKRINQRLQNTKRDRILCCLPLSFDYGLYQVFLSFFSGAVLYLSSGNVPQRIPFLLNKWEITAFPTIPTVANLMVRLGIEQNKDAFRKLRYISFTGEVLSVSLINKLESVFPWASIIPMYGLTECKRVSIMPFGQNDKIKRGSCGLPLEGIKVYLENEDPSTGIGELIVEGENVMEGYWNEERDNSNVFFVNKSNGKRGLRTGDLFRIDSDGYLYFCGRKNGIMKIRGYRVSCLWIENRLKTIKDLLQVAVISVPDANTGERMVICAFSKNREVRTEIEKKLHALPDYLQNYEIVLYGEPLPMNANGKLDRKKLKERMGEKEF